jgi:hypothetical protein
MILKVHRRAPSVALKLHHPLMPVLMLSQDAETILGAAVIGIRGREGPHAVIQSPDDILDFISNLDEALNV